MRLIIPSILSMLLINIVGWSQPANDDCSNAQQITVLDGTCQTGFTTTGASLDAAPANYTVSCQDESETVWFYFIAQGGDVDITVSSAAINGKPEIGLIDATAGNPCDIGTAVPIGCADNTGLYGNLTLSNNQLTIGNTYYINVTMTNQGAFDICINNPLPPANNDCANAQNIYSIFKRNLHYFLLQKQRTMRH